MAKIEKRPDGSLMLVWEPHELLTPPGETRTVTSRVEHGKMAYQATAHLMGLADGEVKFLGVQLEAIA